MKQPWVYMSSPSRSPLPPPSPPAPSRSCGKSYLTSFGSNIWRRETAEWLNEDQAIDLTPTIVLLNKNITSYRSCISSVMQTDIFESQCYLNKIITCTYRIMQRHIFILKNRWKLIFGRISCLSLKSSHLKLFTKYNELLNSQLFLLDWRPVYEWKKIMRILSSVSKSTYMHVCSVISNSLQYHGL